MALVFHRVKFRNFLFFSVICIIFIFVLSLIKSHYENSKQIKNRIKLLKKWTQHFRHFICYKQASYFFIFSFFYFCYVNVWFDGVIEAFKLEFDQVGWMQEAPIKLFGSPDFLHKYRRKCYETILESEQKLNEWKIHKNEEKKKQWFTWHLIASASCAFRYRTVPGSRLVQLSGPFIQFNREKCNSKRFQSKYWLTILWTRWNLFDHLHYTSVEQSFEVFLYTHFKYFSFKNVD